MKNAILLILLNWSIQAQQIDIQGHRGARGCFPENTIPAFIYAMDQGVTTLELDVVITKDYRVVVSHEPWLSHEICLDTEGKEIPKTKERFLNIYSLTYQELLQYDCGSKVNTKFPGQVKMKIAKPLLADVLKATERHMKGTTLKEINYNIEIKSTREGDNIFHPSVSMFSDLVYRIVDDYLPWERATIQSFDFRALNYWHRHYPDVQLAVLIDNLKNPDKNIETLGFMPQIYSPYYKLLAKRSIDHIHSLGMKVVPWTVNDPVEMQKLAKMGVDGLITDYPGKAREIGLCHPLQEE